MVGVFFLLAAVALVSTAADEPAALVLAAIAAGLAVGVKLSLLAPVLALTIGTIAIQPAGRRLGQRRAHWLLAMVLAGGFWYARNLFAVGNPLPWTSLGFLPTPQPPLQQHTGFSVAHYLTNTHVWSAFFGPGLAAGLGPWWAVIGIAAVLGPLLCLTAGAGRTVRMLGLVALASTVAYVVTPESAAGPAGNPLGFAFNLRYAEPDLDAVAGDCTARAGVERPAPAARHGARAERCDDRHHWRNGKFWPARYTLGAVGFGAAVVAAELW